MARNVRILCAGEEELTRLDVSPPVLLASSLRLLHVMLGLTKASCCVWLVFGFLVCLVCVCFVFGFVWLLVWFCGVASRSFPVSRLRTKVVKLPVVSVNGHWTCIGDLGL